jgi:D-aspartate ligase
MLPTLDVSYPTLILKASREIINHGSLAVARTLGRLGVPVYAVVEDAYTPLGRSRYITRSFIWDIWPNDPKSFMKRMSAVADFIGRPAIIIPTDDLSAISVAENAYSLAQWFILPPVSFQLPRRLASKDKFYSLCIDMGMPVARSIVARSIDDVKRFATSMEFPVIVKAKDQWALLNNKFSTKIVYTLRELIYLFDASSRKNSSGVIIQEFIYGDDWITHGYCNSAKGINLIFTGIKLRGYPAGAGSTALGLSLDNETLRCQSDRFLRAIGYSGIVDIDWRKDRRDGQYKILDCNPRVGQNFRMFENAAGVDVVRAQHLDLSGQRIEYAPMIEGRLLKVETFYLMTLLRAPFGGASKADATGDHAPPRSRELAWWSGDDLLPFFVMSLRFLVRVLKRAFRCTFHHRAVRVNTHRSP